MPQQNMEVITAVAHVIDLERQAREIDEAIHWQANTFAKLLLPHLNGVTGSNLLALKLALRDFDLRSQTWKRKP